jgi:hypothetical protein
MNHIKVDSFSVEGNIELMIILYIVISPTNKCKLKKESIRVFYSKSMEVRKRIKINFFHLGLSIGFLNGKQMISYLSPSSTIVW